MEFSAAGLSVLISLFVINCVNCKDCEFGRRKKNLALLRPAVQSSSYGDELGAAIKATDGVIQPQFREGGSCSHTRIGDAWWMVDLGDEYTVQEVAVSNRYKAWNRLNDFVIEVAQTYINPYTLVNPELCAERTSTVGENETAILPCAGGGVRGRYLKIRRRSHGFLQLCEVQVFGPYYEENPTSEICQDEFVLVGTGIPQVEPLMVRTLPAKWTCPVLCLVTDSCVSFTLDQSIGGDVECSLYGCIAQTFSPLSSSKYYGRLNLLNWYASFDKGLT